MFNYSQEKVPHKLLMEISRNDEVPRLVTAHQISRSKDARNKLLLQARGQNHNQSHNVSFTSNDRKIAMKNVQTAKMQTRLRQQISQNDQLRSIIKQLKNELQKLRQINEGLITRIKQVQNSYRTLRSDLEKNNQQQQHKIKINIYSDLQEYIKTAVQRLTLNLKQEKMTVSLQNKLQRFLAQILEINAVSVEQFTKRNRQNQSFSRVQPSRVLENNSFQEQSRAIGTRYITINPQRQQLPFPQLYASIMQRLTGQPRMSKSYAVPDQGFNSSVSQDKKLRNIYATTPQKRKRIFQ